MNIIEAEHLRGQIASRWPHLRVWARDPGRDGQWEVRARNPRSGREVRVGYAGGWQAEVERLAKEGRS